MIRVKYAEDNIPIMVGSTIVSKHSFNIVRNEDKLEKLVDKGHKFIILDNGNKVSAKEYFNKTEKVKITSDITVEEDEVEEEEDEIKCKAITSNGNQCKNEAKYPEEDPKYCGIHKSKLDE